MNPNRKILIDCLSASGAHLTRTTWVHCYDGLASLFRFARQSLQQLCPRRVSYAFTVLFLFQHAIDVQVLYGHEIVPMNKHVGSLVTEIVSTVTDPLMNQSHRFAGSGLVGTPFSLRELGVPPLYFSQGIFIGLKEPLPRYFELIACHNVGLKTHIKASDLTCFRQWYGCVSFHGETDEPLVRTSSLDCACLYCSETRSVKYNWDTAYFTQVDSGVFRIQVESGLFIGHGVISILASETWISRFESLFDSTEESFVGQIDPCLTVLKDLGVCLLFKFGFVLDPRSEFFV